MSLTIVHSPRQGGKTHTLVEWVKAGPGRIIVTADEREAQRLRREYGLTAVQVLSSHAHRQLADYGPLANRIAVDNLDIWLRSVFGPNLTVVTMDSQVRVIDLRMLCPECRQGKHGNCDGTTWDTERDEEADCPCLHRE